MRHFRRWALVTAITCCMGQQLPAQQTSRLFATRTIRCLLTLSAEGDLDGDAPTARISRDSLELIFDQVDVAKGTGRLVGNQGGADVTVIAGRDAITIIEPLQSGVMHATVIYSAQNSSGHFKVVHSRHPSVRGHPLPSQMYGACRPLA